MSVCVQATFCVFLLWLSVFVSMYKHLHVRQRQRLSTAVLPSAASSRVQIDNLRGVIVIVHIGHIVHIRILFLLVAAVAVAVGVQLHFAARVGRVSLFRLVATIGTTAIADAIVRLLLLRRMHVQTVHHLLDALQLGRRTGRNWLHNAALLMLWRCGASRRYRRLPHGRRIVRQR